MMPARIDTNERPVIASITILPSQKQFLETRARELSLIHNQHISVSTILRNLIDTYHNQVALLKSTGDEVDLTDIIEQSV
jgi:hypothetical protein